MIKVHKKPSWVWIPLAVIFPLLGTFLQVKTEILNHKYITPTAAHQIIVLMAPILTLIIWHQLRSKKSRLGRPVEFINGISLGIGLYYTIIVLPLTILAGISIGYIFITFRFIHFIHPNDWDEIVVLILPFMPLVLTWAAYVFYRKIKAKNEQQETSCKNWQFIGFVIALAVLLTLEMFFGLFFKILSMVLSWT